MSKAIHPQIVEIHGMIFANRLKLTEVLSHAGVHRSTWSRWVKGADPRLSTLDKIRDAIKAKSDTTATGAAQTGEVEPNV